MNTYLLRPSQQHINSLFTRNISGGYRFGFNGMEKDDEVHGVTGSSYTTHFRQYDTRIARWLSIDPLVKNFPWQSPYVAFDNNPIYKTDPRGDAAQIPPDSGAVGAVRFKLSYNAKVNIIIVQTEKNIKYKVASVIFFNLPKEQQKQAEFTQIYNSINVTTDNETGKVSVSFGDKYKLIVYEKEPNALDDLVKSRIQGEILEKVVKSAGKANFIGFFFSSLEAKGGENPSLTKARAGYAKSKTNADKAITKTVNDKKSVNDIMDIMNNGVEEGNKRIKKVKKDG